MSQAARRQRPPLRRAQGGHVGGGDEGLGGEVERGDADRTAAGEDDGEGFRVVPGVEFGGGGDVALGDGAGHQHDLVDAVG